MRNLIAKILQCTPHQFDMIVFDHFFLWCELNSYSPGDLQRIMANKKIEQWYQTEYRKHQTSFLKLSEPSWSFKTVQELEELYNKEVSKIREFYPTALLRTVRHKNYSIYGISQDAAKN